MHIKYILNIYIYILHMLLDHFEGGGGGKPSLDETWYRGEEILIKRVFHLTHKGNMKKSEEGLRKPWKL